MMKNTDWKKIGLAALAVLGVIAAAGALHASGAGDAAHGGGGIPSEKWWDLLYRVLNFALLVFGLAYFLRKPIANGLKNRRQGIIEKFEDLESQKAEAERVYKEYEAKLSRIDAEVKSIIDSALAQGETEKEKIIEDAKRAAGDIKRQAEMAIQHELAEAKFRLRSEIAEEAVAMAENIIKKNLQGTDQNKMVEQYLEQAGAIQ